MLFLEHAGKRLTLKQWSDRVKIPVGTLSGRLGRGWPVSEILGTKPSGAGNKPVSKNDAEMELNDGGLNQLPEEFKALAQNHSGRTHRYGTMIRQYHRKEFDRWFEAVYLKHQ